MKADCLRKFRVPATDAVAIKELQKNSVEWLGEFGEAICKQVLYDSGWHYIPLTSICDGGAPMAHGRDGEIILPDLDAIHDGRAAYIEAKAKRQSIVYRLKHQERHGINERNWRHYRRISESQRKKCAIFIVELWGDREDGPLRWTGSLLIETLAQLGEPYQEFREVPPKVYWQRKQFRDLDSFSPRELFALAAGKLHRSFENELTSVLFPMKQAGLF